MSDGLNLYGLDLFGEPVAPPSRGKIADEFLVPPFSVLSAREGWWQERKRGWIAYGIKSEVGRDAVTYQIGDKSEWDRTKQTASLKGGLTLGLTTDPYRKPGDDAPSQQAGTSIFDPVICELAYRWFCPPAGLILDPFAGGSVRGIVASLLGFRYWGCDLRPEQIAANREQAATIVPNNQPEWVTGDALDVLESAPEADFVFSCPPYGDLERYSDDPRDLSTMDYHAFTFALRRIVAKAATRLRADRFACFVVGDFRDKRTGFYRNFVSDTIGSFKACGLELYNEAILVTSVGSLPVRITKQFEASRKLGKTHQNVLVFVKGDPKRATTAIRGNNVTA